MTEPQPDHSRIVMMTTEQIRRAGMRALIQELGPVGFIRFMQQFSAGEGDYSTERHALLDGQNLDEIVARIRRSRQAKLSSPAPDVGPADVPDVGTNPKAFLIS